MGDGNTRLIYFLINAGLVALAVGLVVAVVGLFGNGNLSVEAKYPGSTNQYPAGVFPKGSSTVTVEVTDPTATQKLLSFGTAAVQGILIAVGLWLLRGLAGSVKEGDPFGWANVRRLRGLGFLLVVGAPLGSAIVRSLHWQLVHTLPARFDREVTVPGFTLPVGVMLAGVGAFVLAEVFAYGVRLREDVEATI